MELKQENMQQVYITATDEEALEGFLLLSRTEGIIPALESSHAVIKAVDIAREIGKGGIVVITLSGRGDKDVAQIKNILDTNPDLNEKLLKRLKGNYKGI